MKLSFVAFVLSAIAISNVVARSGTQNPRFNALSPVNQNTKNKALALQASDKKHSLTKKHSFFKKQSKDGEDQEEIDELAYWLKHDGYQGWCRFYLELPEEGGELTTTVYETSTEAVLTTTTATNNITSTITFGNATITGPPATATLTETVIGNSSTVTLTNTLVETSTVYNATTTSWAIPDAVETGSIGAQHHYPIYVRQFELHVVRAACLQILDGDDGAATTKTETATVTETETSTATETAFATTTATLPGFTTTFTPTITATLTETAPGSTITANSTVTSTTTQFEPTQTIIADPCDDQVATWHKADEGSGPCCADWTPVQIPSAKECCYKCWKTAGCPAWFYGLDIENSWQKGFCWTPGYVEPALSDAPASCPAGNIIIDQYLSGNEDLQVAAGPCLTPGEGSWEL
ncbi:hypothetical protein BJ508DRAFT_375163 [Ascobolus immersus RN42]|uniref:Apple domain-containing protein n=1 Tax=Ascobolus immersus RN42 TaxID=1160509 RepID=A0A3N4IGT4_ASCIM|nr:hypothetical protein BJ508DRAFT_375163 [Ascobolus immersus RN42]